jgi:benzoylsuccinyl-CoA thiolase BbsB subunit
MMRNVYIVGVGMTRFGKFPEIPVTDLGAEAILAALDDAGAKVTDIQFAAVGHTRGGSCAGQRAMAQVGIAGIEVLNVENACASGSSAIRWVYQAIRNGLYDIGLAAGMENMTSRIKGVIPPNPDDLEGALGRVMPSVFAMVARRHMEEYGTTIEQLAKISVKNYRHGSRNPNSRFQKETTVEEVLSSRMIADPLTLMMCCPTADGAAAAILCAEDRLKQFSGKKPVKILASALLAGQYKTIDTDMAHSGLAERTARRAYEESSVDPKDLDMIELHDCFAPAELTHYENLGLCKKGEAGRLVDEEKTTYGGDVVVNPSGGLLTKGHPLGATGVAQACESVWQLRGEAGPRQIPGAKLALIHTMGGGVSALEAGACSVHILGV